MTIKTKLTLNIVFLIVIIAAVAVTSVIGMGFVKSRLAYLTGRSTPFQMRTVELQRSIQGAAASLVKVSAAGSSAEFATGKSAADMDLDEVKQSQERLMALAPDSGVKAHEELSAVAADLNSATESLLKSQSEAKAASTIMTSKLLEINNRLKELDRKIRTLQDASSKSYSKSVGDTKSETAKVRSLEQLRLSLKDLQIGYTDIDRATSKKGAIIAQGKVNGALGKVRQNEYLKQSPNISSDVQTLSAKITEFAKMQTGIAGQANVDTSTRDVLSKEVSEKLSSLALAVEQETIVANEHFAQESTRQGTIFASSNDATTILVGNSEFVALGHQLEWLATRIFLAEKPADLDAIAAEITATVNRMESIRVTLNTSLAKIGAKKEQALLGSAAASLAATRSQLLVKDGVIDKVRNKLVMADKARSAVVMLNDIVKAQAEKGKTTVSTAQGEQEKSIISVNRVIGFSTTLIIVIGLAAIAIGIVFGFWIYRSIARPLQQLIELTDQVAEGNLGVSLASGTKDEIGRVQGAMGTMIENLRGIVRRIQDATHTLASSSEELSTTAITMDSGSQEQNSRIDQSAAAMTEMAQTTTDVARNSQETATAAARMKQIAVQGRQAMHSTVNDLDQFAGMVNDAADKVETLGRKSEEISSVINLIKDIADQTNLLALNAAIEAARAGDQGRGFAVVADSVRSLAERTTEATNDIATTVRDMLASVTESITCMHAERDAVERVMGNVNSTLEAINAIGKYVDQVTDMVQRIAVAAEEQSSTTDEITRSMESIAGITRELKSSFADIKSSSDGLARVAHELTGEVAWFKL